MLPKLGDVPGLAIQPSLTQLVAMARSDPASLEEVSITCQVLSDDNVSENSAFL